MKFRVIFFLFFCISCKKETRQIEEENTYQIVSLVINDFKNAFNQSPSFPPPPSNANFSFSCRDSLKSYKKSYEELLKGKTILIYQLMKPPAKSYKFDTDCGLEYNDLLEKFNLLKGYENINLNKININDKDILIPFDEEFNGKDGLVFNLSRIIFNEEKNKAIILVGVKKTNLNGFSTMVFLEKKEYYWKIKCSKPLSLS